MLALRISNRLLGTLCDRVGVAFDVGHDPQRIFKREGESRNRIYGSRMLDIANRVEAGGTLADAVRSQGNYFPDDFVQMIEVGERTGRLERVLSRLAAYYHELAELRTEFINSIIWPVTQLLLAVIVVGLLIYVPSVVSGGDVGDQTDLLGLGLTGASGLRTYAIGVGLAAAAFVAIYLLMRNGGLAFLANVLSQVPYVGGLINIFAESRFVQTLSLALESGLDSWNAVDLAFKSASSPLFASRAEASKQAIRQGRELHVVLRESGLFSTDTIDAVQLGEESGRLPDTLDKQYRYLRTQVKAALSKFTYMASSLIWISIAALLIFIIFRVFSNYLVSIDAAGGAVLDRTLQFQKQ